MHSNQEYADNITVPEIIGYMSVDVSRDYHSDLSQLKFLNSIPEGDLHFDLNHGINKAVKRTTDVNNEKIDLLLKFLLDRAADINFNDSIITYRRSLISIMSSAYLKEHVRIKASLFNGSIYLCTLETPQEKRRRLTRNKQQDRFCAWGYKFEQYMLSDFPNTPPDFSQPVIENEEFSIYFRSMLGEHNLVYGAQIDALLAINNIVKYPPNSGNFEENLSYLKDNVFAELKTNREIQNAKHEQYFIQKLLKCWCQCYLARLKGLLVGFRDDEGVIKRLQWFDTNDIVEYCKHEWEPEPAIRFLHSFLSYVKVCLKKHRHKDNEKPTSLTFDIHGSDSVRVSQCSDDTDKILPEWYTKPVK